MLTGEYDCDLKRHRDISACKFRSNEHLLMMHIILIKVLLLEGILLPATRCYCDLSGSFSDDVGKSHKSPVQ